VKELIR